MPARVRIIGVPMDLGQDRRGVDMGPSAIRYAGLQERLRRLGHSVADNGNIAVPVPEESVETNESGLKHLPVVAEVNSIVSELVAKTRQADEFPIVLGGDHSISAGSAAGARRSGHIGLLWVDAHGDYNTPETTPSGNLHGMPLGALLGNEPAAMVAYSDAPPIQPQEVVLIGVRSLDSGERNALRENNVTVHTMREIDEGGIADVTSRVLANFTDAGVTGIHVSFDMDVLDPQVAPGVGTPVPGGLTYREAHLLMEMLADDGRATSLDLVEINPILDIRNRTAQMAVELAASMLGQTIL